MKRAAIILILLIPILCQAQNVGFTDHPGRVVDAKTGKPLPNVRVTHAIGGLTDADGRFTVRYYPADNDLRVILSHPGYYTDTFSAAPQFVRLRPLPPDLLRQGRPKVAVVLSGG
ncbi:MAG: carboxypeptidase regulatory-like domain-containing protein, partial [Bacteroidales bacterium]|nr:carboxypeptidase regulatory-like domain-containing protein [Bacteroidales bacterium]